MRSGTRFYCTLLLAVGALALAGCHSLRGKSCNKPAAYVSAQSVPPLKVPAGLDHPDTHGALRVPELNEPEPPPRGPKDPCLDEPPKYAVPKPPRPTPAT
jgi:hypothetical protein